MASVHIFSLVCVFYNETTDTKLFSLSLSLSLYIYIYIYIYYMYV